jgi:hypothetical protein
MNGIAMDLRAVLLPHINDSSGGTTTLTGDVTGSGSGSFATTIANDAVTFAKMQNVTGPCVFARETASLGDAAAFPIGTGLSFSGGSLVANGGNAISCLFGAGSLGDLTISAGTTTAAATDFTIMDYDDLTINGTGQLDLQSRVLYVKGTLDLSAAPANAIINLANAGSNGANPGAGNGGAQIMSTSYGSVLPWGSAGGVGGAGSTGAGNSGTVGQGITANMLGITSFSPAASGGNGGATGSAGGTGAGTGSLGVTVKLTNPLVSLPPSAFRYGPSTNITATTVPMLLAGAGGGGAGGGAGAGGLAGGGGGGGGAAGNSVFIFARKIVTSSSTTAGCIAAIGGRGGNGANATNLNTAGGGGGGGGHGGVVHIVCYEFERTSGGAIAGGAVATGGAGGNGGTGNGTGNAGVGGDGAPGGLVIIYEIKTDTFTIVRGSVGSANSGATGGDGGACSASL